MQISDIATNQNSNSSTLLQRIGQTDKTAVKACLDNYGDLLWSLTKKFTDSNEDAEAAIQEIFLNIWRYAGRFEQTNFDELIFVTLIARRQLRKYLEKTDS